MLYFYWKKSPKGSQAVDDSVLRLPAVKEAVSIMLDVWISEQQHELDKYPTGKKLMALECILESRYLLI
jgi:hypothetical protein